MYPGMENQLTVLIPCKNERKNIRACIDAVRGIADEILIADSGSTDGTLELVRQAGGCRVIEREYVNSGDFKNWAIPQAQCPWVLIVDADERVTPQLAAEIHRTLQEGPRHDGYWIGRDNFFLGHRIRYSGWGTDCVLRLFRRDLGRYANGVNLTFADHAEVEVATGNTGWLKRRFDHYSVVSYEQMIHKLNRYTHHQALTWREAGKRPSLAKLVLNGPLRFFHSYVVRWGFLDGAAGFQVCVITGIYSFMKQARLWELHRQREPEAASAPSDLPRRHAA